MKAPTLPLEHLETQSIELPSAVAKKLKAEARKSRLSIPDIIMQWLDDQADGREAQKRLNDLKSGKTKAIPAKEVYASLGL